MAQVAVIGSGVMGSAVTRACADAGLSVAVWNRTPARVPRHAGVTRHDEVADAVRAAPIVVSALLNYDVAHEVLGPVLGELAGRTLVQTSSGAPAEVGPLADAVHGAGGSYLEAAILNYPQAIGTAGAFTVYAGPVATYESVSPLTDAVSGTRIHLGPELTTAKAYLLVAAAYYYACVNGFLECAAMALDQGVPLPAFARSVPMYQAGLQSTVDTGVELIARGDYTFEQAPLTTHLDILRYLPGFAAQAGVTDSFLPAVRDRVQRAVDLGGSREHIAVVVEQFRAGRAAG
ncbi:NAD(P)-dependent oxidoreductase [Saccharothrix obliqua]|uniref:NAD(P)-dependent oxidoreductase n=1 Tax=Saccharothrix obliqua TaxID=2861747 RepID=UPI001C5E2808|nr:NAD(P)-binding domain-containing protein [Saccharothrix obliqua]MBW4717835.1 hypothetical protein [Saccharothrix obliqua]